MIIDIKKIEDKFIEAKQKSKKYDSSILFSITDNIQADFNSLIDFSISTCKEKVYISQGIEKKEFIGWGNILTLNQNKINADINHYINQIIDKKVDCNLGVEQCKAIFIGGQNFNINIPNQNIWNDFPSFNYQIPLILLSSQDNLSTITFNFLINENSEILNIYNSVKDYLKKIKNYLLDTNKRPVHHFALEKIGFYNNNFPERFFKINNKINNSSLEKVIISDIMHYTFSGDFPYKKLLLELKNTYPECTIFLYDYGSKGKYLGASPEKIFSLENSRLEIDALAGSVNRENNKSDKENIEFILNDKKINEEHDIVIKGIVESLKKISPKIHCSSKDILTLKNILHLKTLISLEVTNPNNPMEILNLLSPTPALSGYPKKDSINFISTIEQYDRGWYTGAFGWIDNKLNCNFYAGLRSMFIHENKLYIYGGAGITKDSDEIEEWNEIIYKIRTIEELINGL